jgi:hypothetical protein
MTNVNNIFDNNIEMKEKIDKQIYDNGILRFYAFYAKKIV